MAEALTEIPVGGLIKGETLTGRVKTVSAERSGPMGLAHVRRPCGHGFWYLNTLADSLLDFTRKCSRCKKKYAITLHVWEEKADVEEIA